MDKQLEPKKRPGNLLYKILLVCFAVAFVVVVGVIIHNQFVQNNADKKFQNLVDAVNTEKDTAKVEPSETEEETEVDILTQLGIEVPEKNLDWDALHEENADIYAWIYIPNTNIDYPILQHPTESRYYLDHNLDDSTGYPGCIFTELLNGKDFLDKNTVIHGHNMKNGTMFRTLHNFEDETFFNENRYAFIYMPDDAVYVYDIFAAYTSSDDSVLYCYDFDTAEGCQEYLDDVFDIRDMGAHFRDGVAVTTDNHIITLTTCTTVSSNRYRVQGVLINDPTLNADTTASDDDAA